MTAVYGLPVDLLPVDDPLRAPLADERVRFASAAAHAGITKAVADGFVSLDELATCAVAALERAGMLA